MDRAPTSNAPRRTRVHQLAHRKRKTGTATTKKHRFQSFAERISKLNVDPIRRGDAKHQIHNKDEASHFMSALDMWKDTNLSDSFTDFVREVEPLCQSFAQIVHHESEIFELLIVYIERSDALCLEPLLSLVTHLAHDLGSKFEIHFQRSVLAVNRLAAQHDSIEVIEWSFTCLAWLFKYLSRLLVPDLRPLYDLMAPLLGKQHHKPFVSKFAAESMSFLVRKAGAQYDRNHAPLDTIIAHVFRDLSDAAEDIKLPLQRGLAILFAESIKGVQRAPHSGGMAIFGALVSHLLHASTQEPQSTRDLQLLVESILVSIMHFMDAPGFAPILDSFLEHANPSGVTASGVTISARLLLVIIATRKSSRIADWSGIAKRLADLTEWVKSEIDTPSSPVQGSVFDAVAVALQNCPFDIAVPLSQIVMRHADNELWIPHFLPFCVFCSRLGKDRFETLVMPALQKFIISQWKVFESELCYVLPDMCKRGTFATCNMHLPREWQDHIRATLSNLHDQSTTGSHTELLPSYHAYVCLLEATENDSGSFQAVAEDILALVRDLPLPATDASQNPLDIFAFCRGLPFVVRILESSFVTSLEYSKILTATISFRRRPSFLRVLSRIVTLLPAQPNRAAFDFTPVVDALLENLASPSHELRTLSLSVLTGLYGAVSEKVPEALVIAQEIESSPFTLDSSRAVSLKIRKLASIFADFASDPWVRKAIIAHCFGLLHVRLAPVWPDLCTALRTMADEGDSEFLIMDRAMSWLKNSPSPDSLQQRLAAQQDPVPDQPVLPGFQCVNLSRIDGISLQRTHDMISARDSLQSVNYDELEPLSTISGENRAQALRLLSAMPQLAEKRSRALVPILLNWAADTNITSSFGQDNKNGDETFGSSDTQLISDQNTNKWSRKDQKALLALFGQFVNPSVIFRSKDVHHALLELLCNGDVEIQKAALTALFAWRTPSLTPYRENLLNILDDARFREEVTTFLDVEEGSVIRREHQSELMPVLLRLLYGRVTTRTGLGNTRGSQEARRKAVLTSLSRFGQEVIDEFAAIALGPLQTVPNLFAGNGNLQHDALKIDVAPLRRQLGTLRMLNEMLVILPDQMELSRHSIVDTVIYCLVRSTRPESFPVHEGVHQDASLIKSIRQDAFACLTLLYSKYPHATWLERLERPLFDFVINPKLENLAIETAQAPSNLLKLFAAWTESAQTNRLLFEPNPSLLGKVADCLVEPSAKLDVKRFVLRDIVKPFVGHVVNADGSSSISCLRGGLAHTLFVRIAKVLHQGHEKDILEACVEIFINLQPFVSGFEETRDVISVALHFLSARSKTVSPRLKGQLLELLQHFLQKHDFSNDSELFDLAVSILAKQFSFFKDAPNRVRLAALFEELTKHDEKLQESANFCRKLNSYSDTRLNEPNYEEREAAFQALSESMWSRVGAKHCLPIIHSLLFHMRDKDELSTRTNASAALRRFIQAAALAPHGEAVENMLSPLLKDTVIPAVQAGMHEESELLRNEYIGLLAELVRNKADTTYDMNILLSTDEESSFFNNIVHIQPHRRNRALHRLSADSAKLSSLSIERFLIPLVETIIADPAAEAHNLATEAVNTLEHLAQGLEWNKYRALVQRKVQDKQIFKSKLRIRELGSLINALHHTSTRIQLANGTSVEQKSNSISNLDSSMNLLDTLPDGEALQKSLFNSVFSKLMDQVHYQDEASLDIRILVAVYAVKLILVFPSNDVNNYLPAILVDMCNVLKSRSQEARDSTRKTLADIAAIIGPRYFGFIVKQLRSSLKRGYQLHVLSYTVHSLLVSVSEIFEIGSVDYCLPDLVAVVMDDAFGVTGQEKEAHGYVSSMREVKKKALGFDSMEILATMITLPRISVILEPIGLHLEKPKPKPEKADELFRRIREGLRRNDSAKSRDILMLCFELMTEAMETSQLSGPMTLRSRKMAAFTLELLRRVLDKHEQLKTPQNLAGFLPLFDTVVLQSDDEIQMSLFRLLASIIKVPLQQLDEYAANFVHRAKETIDHATSTNEPLAQAALRLISAVLRERPSAMIQKTSLEQDIAFLLKKITPDLEEPARLGERDRQVAAFNFMKAVMGRGVVIKEVYDTMETVREVMITSQDSPIPDLARGVYSRFILDYFPAEGKGMARQLDFLTTNLQYEHARGRKSVMEVIAFLLNKMDRTAVQPVLVSFFLPLVLVLIVDQKQDCRTVAELLLRKVFERADKERIKLFKSQMMKWLVADKSVQWKKASLRVWQLFFEEHKSAAKDAQAVHEHVCKLVRVTVDDDTNHEGARSLLQASLDLYKSLSSLFPSVALGASTSETWLATITHISSEDLHIRATTAELLDMYLGDFALASQTLSKEYKMPLVGSHGLELQSTMLHDMAKKCTRLLSFDINIPGACDITIKNLSFISRVAHSSPSDGQVTLSALFEKASAILRAEPDATRPPRAKLTALDLLAALYTTLPADAVTPSLPTVLLPLTHISDPVIAAPTSANPAYGEVQAQLVARAAEVTEQIREKVGAAEFLAQMGRVQKGVREKREERRAKRAVEAVAEPEKVEREKRRKREKEKDKRRERNQHAAGMRRGW